jgi:hypothetical protein
MAYEWQVVMVFPPLFPSSLIGDGSIARGHGSSDHRCEMEIMITLMCLPGAVVLVVDMYNDHMLTKVSVKMVKEMKALTTRI